MYHTWSVKKSQKQLCKEWAEDFLAFKKWAYENGYNDSLCIFNPFRDEEALFGPTTAAVGTYFDLVRSIKEIVKYTYKGMLLRDYCTLHDLSASTVMSRIYQGMSIEEAVTIPIKSYRRIVTGKQIGRAHV